jgi:hypothetical protein
MKVWQRLSGYLLLLVGVLVGAVGLIALRSRAESSADVPWGWPEAMVLLIAVPVVVAGLWILVRRFDGRS